MTKLQCPLWLEPGLSSGTIAIDTPARAIEGLHGLDGAVRADLYLQHDNGQTMCAAGGPDRFVVGVFKRPDFNVRQAANAPYTWRDSETVRFGDHVRGVPAELLHATSDVERMITHFVSTGDAHPDFAWEGRLALATTVLMRDRSYRTGISDPLEVLILELGSAGGGIVVPELRGVVRKWLPGLSDDGPNSDLGRVLRHLILIGYVRVGYVDSHERREFRGKEALPVLHDEYFWNPRFSGAEGVQSFFTNAPELIWTSL